MCKIAVAYHMAKNAKKPAQDEGSNGGAEKKFTESTTGDASNNNFNNANKSASFDETVQAGKQVFAEMNSNVTQFFRSNLKMNEWVAFGWTDGSYSGSDHTGSVNTQNQ